MKYYLLSLNIDKFKWEDAKTSYYDNKMFKRWSCGNNKSIKIGDMILFIKLGSIPKGIFAVGISRSCVYQEISWNDINKKCNYIDVEIIKQVDFDSEYFLSQKYLKQIYPEMNWSPIGSGIQVKQEIGEDLIDIFGIEKEKNNIIIDSEVDSNTKYIEGAIKVLKVNRYERNPKARRACIKYYGCKCYVCGENLSGKYGDFGEGVIHVHHEIPLSKIKEGYEVDPIKDMKPLCPNCHAVIHRKQEVLKIEELKEYLENDRV